MIQLDTHVVIWLAEHRQAAFSPTARRMIDRGGLQVSPMVILELETLHESGKLKIEPERLLALVDEERGLSRSEAAFASVIGSARSFAWTRDPFDRLIVANAMADGVPLLTADALILRHFTGAVW